ncbi:hypothetical protein [Psychromonas hadalis]|uniref:hypothetical protein n=1 Tax=Psychromonas hadalis TaxID=211669 RepID=UPI0003B643BC|nr:hypothetical protein [Psychromonas hadalis]
MKLSYALFFLMLLVTATSVALSFVVKDQFQLLGCNVSGILSMGLLLGASLYAFDDYCKEKQGELGTLGQLTQTMLKHL